MTSIVRPFKQRWTAEQRIRIGGQNTPVAAIENEFEEMERDADRLCREARQRIQAERMREGER